MHRLNEKESVLLYALTPNLGRSAKSVTVKRYSAQMKSTGTFGDAELQEALAAGCGRGRRVPGRRGRPRGRGQVNAFMV